MPQHTTVSLSSARKRKRSIESGKAFSALLADLSKAFDCLNHKLPIVKLNDYGSSLPALRLIHDYLSHRKQRTRDNNSSSNAWGTTRLNFGTTSIQLFFSRFVSCT